MLKQILVILRARRLHPKDLNLSRTEDASAKYPADPMITEGTLISGSV
jgi:hypothetical protein